MKTLLRKAIHAGSWYPEDTQGIEGYIPAQAERRKVIAAVCPHAGWMYSGRVTGEVFAAMEPAELYILIGPDHRGEGEPVSVFPEGSWETPLGNLDVDAGAASDIVANSARARLDAEAHSREHSLEVQLPFIRLCSPGAKIVPVSMFDYSPAVCDDLGMAVAHMVRARGLAGKTVLLASTDMSHYVPAAYAKQVDSLALERVLQLDPEGLLKTVRDNEISMCGAGPTAAVLRAARELGATRAQLTRYATSGDVTGDQEEVVGYAGVVIW